MSEFDALAHAVQLAFSAVAATAGLSWEVKNHIYRQMERAIRAHAYPNPTPADFAAWIEEELADLLSREDIAPLCRFHLSTWFAGEVLKWLTGEFEDVA